MYQSHSAINLCDFNSSRWDNSKACKSAWTAIIGGSPKAVQYRHPQYATDRHALLSKGS